MSRVLFTSSVGQHQNFLINNRIVVNQIRNWTKSSSSGCCLQIQNNNHQHHNNNNNNNNNVVVTSNDYNTTTSLNNNQQQLNVSCEGDNIVKRNSSRCQPAIQLNGNKQNSQFLLTTKPFLTTFNNSNSNYQQICRNMSTKCDQDGPFIGIENMNPHLIKMEYAVRGPLVIRAAEIEKELKSGVKKPFDQVIRANIGDCHAMGQQPITFLREVLALTSCKELLNSSEFPEESKKRAKIILSGCMGESIGSYTDSVGIEVIRRQVAEFIEKRDGYPSDYMNIVLTGGATIGIKSMIYMLKCKLGGKPPGIMVPIPQYPLYSATIAEYGMDLVGYYLNESTNWGLDVEELKRSVKEARKTCNPRAICVINPGNPTGQVLKRENIEAIIKFAYEEKLYILADEVYQHNVYDPNSEFHSFKKVLMGMGEPYSKMELASFMSTSKGYLGECGIRGGYMELVNLCPKVKATLLKTLSASLCPNTPGQVAVSCMVLPPEECSAAYTLYMQEKANVLNSLKERANLVYKAFNSFEGFSCNVVQGAMYAFPQIKIPQKAIDAAKKEGKTPDTFYAFALLEESGICIVPGSGFGQKEGTYHFRTTILPQTEKLKIMLEKFKLFHTEFMKKYK